MSPRRLVPATGAALALVLAAALVTLSVRLTGTPRERLAAARPRVESVARAYGLEVKEKEEIVHRPCRVNALVGATRQRAVAWTFPARSGPIRQVEVSVYVLDDPSRRLGDLERGLLECGGFDSKFGNEPYRFTTSDVRRDGDVLRWRLTGSGAGQQSAARARASVVGPYLLYVLDHRLAGESPQSYVEAYAQAVEAVLRESL